MSRQRWAVAGGLGTLLLVALLALVVWQLNRLDEAPPPAVPVADLATQRERGAYLARAGNCAGCHTVAGGVPYAGGRGIETPFGTVFAPNLTPHATTGLGDWSSEDFWRALHNGRGRDGRLLTPAFPYPNFSRVTRADADALFAYLQGLAPVDQPRRPHELRFPYDSQAALAVWRALYFRPAVHAEDPRQDAEWNRGVYLVEGLGHCSACHAPRNALGASGEQLGGGLMPMRDWYAPALDAAHEAGVAGWPRAQVVELLRTGRTELASASGPMAEVVRGSTQHLSDADLGAMALYLQRLPQQPVPVAAASSKAPPVNVRGERLYAKHCADCHGEAGEGVPGAYPALAGNRALLLDPPANPVRIVLGGGFAPATAGNPRPYGMPPFAAVLADDEVADLLSYTRNAWGNSAPPVTPLEVHRLRDRALR
ncbi:cytochrome c [Rivibacter subsaxonicus]|uniref:Mono/diheme cytochrome c family protein n=1 Tax=Rivibacter subsaxonicus TaxID=457575 RepID=A0A4Q7W0Q3_9BURK|nr:cytochrome c [Rivibacter subsaxonicus]RZU02583.1 mono/diheme cytochrome c family protein [Rivibacter subsaxonicus]